VHAGFHPSTPLSRSANELPGPVETINDPADHSLGGFFSATLLILVLLLARAAVCRLLGPRAGKFDKRLAQQRVAQARPGLPVRPSLCVS
jgi:hypothetical protein